MLAGLLSKLNLGKVLGKVPGAIQKGSKEVLYRDVLSDEGFARWIGNTRLALKAKRNALENNLAMRSDDINKVKPPWVTADDLKPSKNQLQKELDRLNKEIAEIDEDIPLQLKTKLKDKYIQTIKKDMEFKDTDSFIYDTASDEDFAGVYRPRTKPSLKMSQAEQNWRKKHGVLQDEMIPTDLMREYLTNPQINRGKALRINKIKTDKILPDLKDYDFLTRRVSIIDKSFDSGSLMDRLSTGAHELKHALQSKFNAHRYAIRQYMPHIDTKKLPKNDWFHGKDLDDILDKAPYNLLAQLQQLDKGVYRQNEWANFINRQTDEFGMMSFRDADFKVPKGLMGLFRKWNKLGEKIERYNNKIMGYVPGSKMWKRLFDERTDTILSMKKLLYKIDFNLYLANPDEISARLTEIRGIPKALRDSSSELREIQSVAGKGESIKNVLDKAWAAAPLTSMGLLERVKD